MAESKGNWFTRYFPSVHRKGAAGCVPWNPLRRAVAGAALGVWTGLVLAQDLPSPALMTTQDLGVLFDEHAVREMKTADIAGAAIVVVKDGAVVFARGYGHADVERKTPVSPDHTLFRIASLSKVVTFTAVMQLVEQGKIDLDADIGRYLDFPIPAAFGKPVTMRHLMSHTAGFEETVQGRWVEPGQVGPLRDYLVQRMPKRLFAPGAVPAYSTYGTTLAGYIVERVSGESFDTYVEKHIFAPLGMRHSSFAQPLPPRLAPMLAQGYVTGSGPAGPFDTVQAAPAASMSSTPMDMARFMLAHLGGPAAPGPALLTPETLARMHAVQFRHHPAGPGITLGMFETDEVAPRSIGHPGDIPRFVSALYLFPERRIGLFIVQNTEAGSTMRNALLKAFSGRYLAPPSQAAAVPRAATADEYEQIPGSYRSSWRVESSPLALNWLLKQSVVRIIGPGTLVVDTHVGPSGKPAEWHKVDAGTWQSATNPLRRLYFSRNEEGRWEMSRNWDTMAIMEKSAWHQHKSLILAILPLSLFVIVLSVSGWPLSALVRRLSGPQAAPVSQSRKVRNCVRLAALLHLAPWAVYGGIALVVANDLLFIASAACGVLLRVVQLMAWLAVAGTIGAIWAASITCRDREASWLRRVHHVALALACLGATAMAWQGGLLIWNGRF